MKFKTKLYEDFREGYLCGHLNASSDEIEREFYNFIRKYNIYESAKEIAEKNLKTGKYWLTKEGRKEIREIWDNDADAIPPIFLDEIERLEKKIIELELKKK